MTDFTDPRASVHNSGVSCLRPHTHAHLRDGGSGGLVSFRRIHSSAAHHGLLGEAELSYSLNTLVVEAGGSVQGHPQLHSKFKASMD